MDLSKEMSMAIDVSHVEDWQLGFIWIQRTLNQATGNLEKQWSLGIIKNIARHKSVLDVCEKNSKAEGNVLLIAGYN